jgi:prefoldin subunit 4
VRCFFPPIRLLQKAADDYEEAGNEIMLMDDEVVPFLVGEVFMHLPREEVEERLQKSE